MRKNLIRASARLAGFRPSQPLLFAFIGCAFLGLSPILVRVSEIGPIATGFYRLFFSIPLAYLWLVFEHRANPRTFQPHREHDWVLLIASGFFFALDLALWHWSLKFTSIVNAALFNNFTAFYVSLLGWVLFSNQPPFTFFIALALGLGGSFILAGDSFHLNLKHLGGDLLALASALCYAGYIMIIKKLRLRFNTPTLMLWSGASASLFLLILSLLTREQMIPSTLLDWTAIVGLALVVHIGGQGLLAYSMGHLSAGFVSLLNLTSPVISAIIAWILFNEAISFMHSVGGAMILTGIVIARRGERLASASPSASQNHSSSSAPRKES